MNSRERFLTAMSGGIPDRVPVTPDTSNYIPCRRTGLPFWEIYFKGAIPLWRAYLETADYFGFDAWNCSGGGPTLHYENTGTEWIVEDRFDVARDAMIRHSTIRGKAGTLTETNLCFRGDPPSMIEKPIKDLARDLPIWLSMQGLPMAYDRQMLQEQRAECERRGHAFGLGMGYPGLHAWVETVHGGLEPLAVAAYETPELLDQWMEFCLAQGDRHLDLILAEKPDYVLMGGSGTITLSSPTLAKKYAITALKRWSRRCKAAGLPVIIHSCGKSQQLVEMVVADTDVNCVNPLEIAPMGDVELADLKRVYGKKLALMGNLHTTEVMLRGTPGLVRRRSLEAMRDAGVGGGFILSTGDQCPRDTPDENIFAMVEAAKKEGVYDPRTGELPRVEKALRSM